MSASPSSPKDKDPPPRPETPPPPGTDRYLRRWGFEISSRPLSSSGGGVNVWRDRWTGRLVPEPKAHEIARKRAEDKERQG